MAASSAGSRKRKRSSVEDGQASSNTPEIENARWRSAWGFDEFDREYGGVLLDALGVIRPVARHTFDASATATDAGFGVAEGVLQRIGALAERGGFACLRNVARRAESATGCVRRAAGRVHRISRHVTLGALEGAAQGLEAAGAEPGAVLRQTLGADEVAACLTVARTMARLNEDTRLVAAMRSPAAMVRALLKCYQEQAPLEIPSSVAQSSDLDIELAALGHWMWLSAAVYGPFINHATGLFRHCPASDFLSAAVADCNAIVRLDALRGGPSKMYRPGFALVVDHAARAVVVVVRGTSNFRDLLTDLVCRPLTLQEGDLVVGVRSATTVHEGMWRAASSLRTELERPVQEALMFAPGYRLIFTGHSLGGGVATLLCLMWLNRFPHPPLRAACFAFGPAACLDDASARAAAPFVTSLVVGEDLVPRLSLGSATQLIAAISRQTQESPLGAQDQAPSARTAVPPLRPAGRLLHIARGHPRPGCQNQRRPRRATVTNTDAFAALRISHRTNLDHMPREYLQALGEI